MTVMTALLLPALVFGYVLIDMDQIPKTYAPPVDLQALPIDDDGSSGGVRLHEALNVTNYGEIAPPSGGEVGPDDPSVRLRPFMDWGDDVLVGTSSTTPTFGVLSTDSDTNGDIYIGLLDPNSGVNDTVTVWRSTNGGLTWAQRYKVFGNSTYGEIKDFVLRVGHDAGGTWIYNFILNGAATTSGGIWCTRIRADNSNPGSYQVRARGDSILRISADRNIESPEHLFVGWQDIADVIHVGSSNNAGQTWGNFRNISSPRWNVSVCAGGDGYVYVGFIAADSSYYRVARYTNNLISPSWVFANPDSSPTDRRFRDLSTAAARTAPGASQWARSVVTYLYVPNGNVIVRHAWTTSGNTSWTAGPYPPTNITRQTWQARGPYVRCSYTSPLFRAVVTMPETTTAWDSVVYAFSRSSGADTWEDRATFNDNRATGEFGAVVDYCKDMLGGYVAYRLFGGNEVWVDGYNFTGVEEQPAALPVLGSATVIGADARVRLHVARAGRVAVALVDNAGRVVGRLHEGTLAAGEHSFALPGRLSRGVYFLRLQTDAGTDVTKLVRLQ